MRVYAHALPVEDGDMGFADFSGTSDVAERLYPSPGIRDIGQVWSGKRDSNPRPSAWERARSATSDAYLRLPPCERVQGAAPAGIGDGPTAPGGPSEPGAIRLPSGAFAVCWCGWRPSVLASRCGS